MLVQIYRWHAWCLVHQQNRKTGVESINPVKTSFLFGHFLSHTLHHMQTNDYLIVFQIAMLIWLQIIQLNVKFTPVAKLCDQSMRKIATVKCCFTCCYLKHFQYCFVYYLQPYEHTLEICVVPNRAEESRDGDNVCEHLWTLECVINFGSFVCFTFKLCIVEHADIGLLTTKSQQQSCTSTYWQDVQCLLVQSNVSWNGL